ncbi:MAG: glycosyltransferase family 1 protein [Actinomycetota bacterium]|nr:glycosyltransferase family 1 protein [Actinomycetota bacterium]
MRVAIVAESFLPAVNGVTNSVLRTVEHLRAGGHEVLLIAPGPGPSEHEGVRVERVRAFSLPGYDEVRVGSPVTRLTSILRDFDPHVVHLAAPTMLGAAGMRAAGVLDLPTVAVFQTDLAGFARRYRLGLASPLLWAWLRRIHEQATVTLAPSTSAAWTLTAHGIPRVERWMRGVDLQRFHPQHRDPATRHSLAPNDEVIVGFVGRLAKEKQVHRLAPLTALANTKVVIVGDGPERARLERQLPRATFTGFRAGLELSQMHASFDVFAHTGLDETFCQAVQEALASGVPVVAPAAGGPIDLVTHGANGYLWSPEQPEMLVGGVAELAASPVRRQAMGLAARHSVEGRPWSAVMAELSEHYRRSIDGTGSVRELVA